MESGLMLMPTGTIEAVIARRNLMVDFVRQAMTPNTDYGKIPGTEKNTLLKPGAEKLNTLFGLTPRFVEVRTVEDWTGAEHNGEPFFFYWQKCQLLRDGVVVGEGDGSCNSWEKKYRYRAGQRVCPNCGKPTIFKSKNQGEGYYCWTKKDGCGAKFAEDAAAILSQQVGQVPNPDIFDQTNTLLKMAQKRALIAATLLAVNASEFFTQDMDDMYMDAGVKIVDAETSKPTNGDAPKAEAKEVKSEPAPTLVPGTSPLPPAVRVPSAQNNNRQHTPLSPVQRAKLTELWKVLHGAADEVDVIDSLNNYFISFFKHGMKEATYEEGAKMTGQLLSEIREGARQNA